MLCCLNTRLRPTNRSRAVVLTSGEHYQYSPGAVIGYPNVSLHESLSGLYMCPIGGFDFLDIDLLHRESRQYIVLTIEVN